MERYTIKEVDKLQKINNMNVIKRKQFRITKTIRRQLSG